MNRLLIMAVLACSPAHADNCMGRVQGAFEHVAPRAERYGVIHASWRFKWFMPYGVIAQVWPDSTVIDVSEARMCALDDVEIEAVIAHEFGHLISRIIGREDMLTKAGREDKANYYGAKLISDSTKYLQLIDGRCTKGYTYDCETAASWRAGIIN